MTPTGRTARGAHVVAVDVGNTAVRAVEVEFASDGPRLLKRGSAPLPRAVWDDLAAGRDQLAQSIRAALSSAGITAASVSACLPRRLVTLKYGRLPHAEPEQIRGMVQFEAQQYIPFPLDDVVLDHQIVSEEGDELTTVMIVAARRQVVDDLLAAFDKAGLEVSRLSVSAVALAEHGGGDTLPLALLDVDEGEMDMAVVSAGRVLFTRAASLIESTESPGGIHLLAGEVVRSLSAYQNEYRAHPVNRIVVATPNGQMPAIEAALGDILDVPISRMNGKLLPAGDPDALAYATATGLALEGAGHGITHINLVPASRVERKAAAQRRGRMTLAGIGVLALVVLGVVLLSQSLAKQSGERAEAERANNKLQLATAALTKTKTAHDAMLRNYQVVANGLDRSFEADDALKAVSDAAPKGGAVYLSQLMMDRVGGTLAIHGTAKQESAVTDMVLALQNSGVFAQVRLNYLGDAQAEAQTVSPAPAAGAAAGAAASKPKPAANTSFLITCRLKKAISEKAPSSGTSGRAGASSTAATSAASATENSR